MRKLIYLTFLSSTFYSAQILNDYPTGQNFYKGGIENFYKEASDFLKSKKILDCGKEQIYVPRILVTSEGIAKIVQDADSENISKNKCAYDEAILVIKNLKNWQPAMIKNKPYGALVDFIFYPYDLVNNITDNYNPSRYITPSVYPGGNKQFVSDFHDNFMTLFDDYHINGEENLEYYVNENGQISNARIFPDISNNEFKKEFFRTLKRLNKIWQPATYKKLPIRQRRVMTADFSTTFEN